MVNKRKQKIRERMQRTGESYERVCNLLDPFRQVAAGAVHESEANGTTPGHGPTRIVVASRQGGTGKSRIAALLSVGLARAGHRVLAIDVNTQWASLTGQLDAGEREGRPYTILDLCQAPLGRPKVLHSVHQGHDKLFDLIPGGSTDLAVAAVARQARLHHMEQAAEGQGYEWFGKCLGFVEAGYDFVVMDSMTTLESELGRAALAAAHLIVSPIDLRSVRNVRSGTDLMRLRKDMRLDTEVAFVGNLYREDHRLRREALSAARSQWGHLLLPMVIADTVMFDRAAGLECDLKGTPTADRARLAMDELVEFVRRRSRSAVH